MTWWAFVDESMRAPSGAEAGYYVLAAAQFDATDVERVREATKALAPRRGVRFHWRDASDPERAKAVGVVAGLPALHLVVVGTPLSPRKQERARRLCMARLLAELDAAGVERVWLDARRPKDNSRDLDAIDAFRTGGTIGAALIVDHAYSDGQAREPLLWLPDIVAGAMTRGKDDHRSVLEPVLTVRHIDLD